MGSGAYHSNHRHHFSLIIFVLTSAVATLFNTNRISTIDGERNVKISAESLQLLNVLLSQRFVDTVDNVGGGRLLKLYAVNRSVGPWGWRIIWPCAQGCKQYGTLILFAAFVQLTACSWSSTPQPSAVYSSKQQAAAALLSGIAGGGTAAAALQQLVVAIMSGKAVRGEREKGGGRKRELDSSQQPAVSNQQQAAGSRQLHAVQQQTAATVRLHRTCGNSCNSSRIYKRALK